MDSLFMNSALRGGGLFFVTCNTGLGGDSGEGVRREMALSHSQMQWEATSTGIISDTVCPPLTVMMVWVLQPSWATLSTQHLFHPWYVK